MVYVYMEGKFGIAFSIVLVRLLDGSIGCCSMCFCDAAMECGLVWGLQFSQ